MALGTSPEVPPVAVGAQEISMSEQRRRRAEQREKNRRDAWAVQRAP
jgi:hypothetical protein